MPVYNNPMIVCVFSARCILGQIVEGLLVLHNNNIMHRDISMGNVLLSRDRQSNLQAVCCVLTCTARLLHETWVL